ncbi:MAG: hypothetical protein ABH851_04720, partial [Methanobacteriota archaeon]
MKNFSREHQVISVLTVVLLLHSFYFNHIEDDAFISFRYSKNFARGFGLVFNKGIPVEGYTNFLYTLILGVFLKLGFNDIVLAARLIGVFSAIGILFYVLKISKLISGNSNSWFNFISCTLLSLNTAFAFWTLGGMETQLFMFFAIIGSYHYLREERISVKSVTFFILASLTRPEGILLFFLTVVHKIYVNSTHKKSFLTRQELIPILIFIVLFSAYLLWRQSYYGFPLPNTFYNKVGSGIEQYKRGFRYLAEFSRDFGGILFILPILLFTKRKVDFWLSYFSLTMVSYLAYILFVGGGTSVMYRIAVPVLPYFYVLLQE